MKATGVVGAIAVLIATQQPTVDHIDLDTFRECPGCRIQMRRDVIIGHASNAIDVPESWATFNPATRQYTAVVDGLRLEVFDSIGKHLRSFGRKGEGPGEFSVIRDLQFRADTTLVVDVGLMRLTVIGPGKPFLVATTPVTTAGRFVQLAGDTLVIAAMSGAPNAVGLPLHRTTSASPNAWFHFGSETGEFNAAAPWSNLVFVAPSASDRSVWVARPAYLRFEEWSIDGKLLRLVEGSPKWFPPVFSIPPFGRQPPATRMRQFRVVDDRLWVVTWVASADWKKGVASARREPDEVIINTADYFATRIDAYDLRLGLHLASLVIPRDHVQLLVRDREVLMQWVEEADDGSLAIVLSSLEVKQPGR